MPFYISGAVQSWQGFLVTAFSVPCLGTLKIRYCDRYAVNPASLWKLRSVRAETRQSIPSCRYVFSLSRGQMPGGPYRVYRLLHVRPQMVDR